MTTPILSSGLLTSTLLLFTACTVDISRSAASAPAIEDRSLPWAVTLQRQSSIAGSGLREIDGSDPRSDNLLPSSSLGITSLRTYIFGTSSVNHVALYLDEGQTAEVTGAGVQTISVQQALAHGDRLFALRVPNLTPDQAAAMKDFAWQVKDSGYNYRGIIQLIPYMVTKPLYSLSPFSRSFRQQCMSDLAKTQLDDTAGADKKAWLCSEFVNKAFVRARHPLTLAQAAWINLSDLLHIRGGDVAIFKSETQLQYIGHLKPGAYLQTGKLVGLDKSKDDAG